MMSETSSPAPIAASDQLSGRSFSPLPITRETPGKARHAAGSIWAAHPVTTMRASGFSRCARRIACRACRSASAVTAQVLTITSSPEADAACPRMTSLS